MIVHRIVCCVPGTDLILETYPLPPGWEASFVPFLGIDADDPGILQSYRLDEGQVARLTQKANLNASLLECECFLEAYVDDAIMARLRSKGAAGNVCPR